MTNEICFSCKREKSDGKVEEKEKTKMRKEKEKKKILRGRNEKEEKYQDKREK